MFLFDKKDDYIGVYKLEPKLEQIIEYRKKEIEKIPQNERFSGWAPRHIQEKRLQYYFEYSDEDTYYYVLSRIAGNYYMFESDDLSVDGAGNYVRNTIIKIPETLYLFEALFQGSMNLIGNSDISSQLNLFNIEYVDTIACGLLKKTCDYNLINESFDSIMYKMEINENVMKRVRKLAGK